MDMSTAPQMTPPAIWLIPVRRQLYALRLV